MCGELNQEKCVLLFKCMVTSSFQKTKTVQIYLGNVPYSSKFKNTDYHLKVIFSVGCPIVLIHILENVGEKRKQKTAAGT